MTTSVLVLADTHVRPGRVPELPEPVWTAAHAADLILHAGDVMSVELLDALAGIAPTRAVLGNNDTTLVGTLPETIELTVDGVALAMVHDTGRTEGRPERMRRRFPEAQLVIYGHSHAPDDSVAGGGPRLFNPGSCTQRRRAPQRTFGVVELDGGAIRARLVAISDQLPTVSSTRSG